MEKKTRRNQENMGSEEAIGHFVKQYDGIHGVIMRC